MMNDERELNEKGKELLQEIANTTVDIAAEIAEIEANK